MTDKPQLTKAELGNMPEDAIAQALKAGQFDELLAGRGPGAEPPPAFEPPEGADQGARGKRYATPGEWLRSLPPDEVVRLLHEGLLDPLLRGETTL